MTTTLAQMTQEELENLLSDVFERKILELLVDPDKELLLQPRSKRYLPKISSDS